MPVERSRAAYMREYRARKRLGRPPASQDPDVTPVFNDPHAACDARIAALETSLRLALAKIDELAAPAHRPVEDILDDLL